MTDDQQTPSTADPAMASDPLASLEDLLAKAKAKRQPSATGVVSDDPLEEQAVQTDPLVPTGPTPEEIEAQNQAARAAREQAAEAIRLQQLAEQQAKMSELQATPQFEARQEQNASAAAEEQQLKAEQQGHVIHQVGDSKV